MNKLKQKNATKVLLILMTVLISSACNERFGKSEKDVFISELLAEMTIEEKIAQLNLITPTAGTGPFKTKMAMKKLEEGTAANALSVRGNPERIHKIASHAENTRLKIPYLLALDIIHGYKTVFPIPLGLSCTWDTTLIEHTARIAAIEATAMGYHQTYSPMVDISRDPRWGRVMEGSGEDPYLGSLIARAMVKGYQGDDLSSETSLLACVKHFALYGASEAGRDYNTTDMSRITMYQNYLPPYKAAIDAGAGSVMTSFNDVDGVPATANKRLLTDLLRDEWGFEGFVVSDYNCVQELIPHGHAEDYKDAVKKSIDAGLDMDMASEGYSTFLKALLDEGEISMEQIDKACARVLGVKYDMGLFDDPYRNYNPEKADEVILSTENKELARQAAQKSIVLLQNKNNTLPLSPDKKIALIGPFNDSAQEMFSMWSPDGFPDSVVTIVDGMKQRSHHLTFTDGTFITDNEVFLKNHRRLSYEEDEQQAKMSEAAILAKNADVVVAVLGESRNMSGEAKSMTNIGLPNCQKELLKKLKATSKPIVLVLLNGRPMILTDILEYADAIMTAWRPGTMAGVAIADVLYGDYNPSGKLTMTFPRSVGQIPIYYNHKNTGRPYVEGSRRRAFRSNYLDEQNKPLFPFGFGLSYTTFDYGDVILSDTLISGESGKLTISVDVTNSGKYAGEETLQLYLHDIAASVVRPVKELKQFKKVFLQVGESKKLVFELTTEDLKFFKQNLDWDWEPGKFTAYIGTNSENVKEVCFEWKK